MYACCCRRRNSSGAARCHAMVRHTCLVQACQESRACLPLLTCLWFGNTCRLHLPRLAQSHSAAGRALGSACVWVCLYARLSLSLSIATRLRQRCATTKFLLPYQRRVPLSVPVCVRATRCRHSLSPSLHPLHRTQDRRRFKGGRVIDLSCCRIAFSLGFPSFRCRDNQQQQLTAMTASGMHSRASDQSSNKRQVHV